jgi:hypothetical protein
VEGDTAKLSDGYYAVLALTQHVKQLVGAYGSLMSILENEHMDIATLRTAMSFVGSFLQTWQPRAEQALSDVVLAAAIVDPR